MLGAPELKLTIDVLRGRRKLFYGWWVLASCVLIMTVVSGFLLVARGLYVQPLEQEFGWTRTQVSLGFSAGILTGGFAAFFVGVWIDRFGPRSCVLVGSAMTGVTFLMLASTGTLWQWYVFGALNAVFGQMTSFIPVQVLASRWFDQRRGAALSILGIGFSLGGFLILPLAAFVIEATSWRGGFIFSGVVVACLIVPLGLFVLRDWPADKGTYPDGRPPDDGRTTVSGGRLVGLTLHQAVRQPLFWVLSFALMLFFFGLIGWSVHIVPFFESRDISRETAALLISLSSGAGIVSRLLLGAVADRFRRFEVAAVFLISAVAFSLISLLLEGGWLGIGLFLTFWIVGTSAGALIESLSLTRAFGLAHFATIFGVVVVIETCGEVLSPSIAGLIFDRTGSYDLALVMYACTFSVSALLFAVASRMRRPVERSGA